MTTLTPPTNVSTGLYLFIALLVVANLFTLSWSFSKTNAMTNQMMGSGMMRFGMGPGMMGPGEQRSMGQMMAMMAGMDMTAMMKMMEEHMGHHSENSAAGSDAGTSSEHDHTHGGNTTGQSPTEPNN